MTLYEQWQNLINNQTDETFEAFWQEYSAAETRIYSGILDDPGKTVTGTFKELADKYKTYPAIFMGFLDGINTSLSNNQNITVFDENSVIELEIDYEKLYFNMLEAKADYLYTLPQWDNILTEKQRREIVKVWKKSKTIVKEKGTGRNEPCLCGSGKKYKKCCGAN